MSLKLFCVAKPFKRCPWNAQNFWRHVCSEYMQRCCYVHLDSDNMIIDSHMLYTCITSHIAYLFLYAFIYHRRIAVYNSRSISPQITLFHEVGYWNTEVCFTQMEKIPDIFWNHKKDRSIDNWSEKKSRKAFLLVARELYESFLL